MSEKKLNLNKENVPPEPMTPEKAAEAMAKFYDHMSSGVFNLVAIHNDFAKTLREEISVDLNDIAFYLKKLAIKMEAVSELEIEEREQEADEPPPANSSNK